MSEECISKRQRNEKWVKTKRKQQRARMGQTSVRFPGKLAGPHARTYFLQRWDGFCRNQSDRRSFWNASNLRSESRRTHRVNWKISSSSNRYEMRLQGVNRSVHSSMFSIRVPQGIAKISVLDQKWRRGSGKGAQILSKYHWRRGEGKCAKRFENGKGRDAKPEGWLHFRHFL